MTNGGTKAKPAAAAVAVAPPDALPQPPSTAPQPVGDSATAPNNAIAPEKVVSGAPRGGFWGRNEEVCLFHV